MTYSSGKPIDIHAFIMAEGGSLRLRPLTEHLPTSLVPVGGTPILDHQIQTLLRAGVGTICVVGGYRAAQVQQACRAYGSTRFCFNPRYSRGEPLLSSLATVEGIPQSPVLIIRGDLIFDGALLQALLDPEIPDASVAARGRGIGLYRVKGDSLRGLFQSARDALDHRGPDPELFSYLESFLAPRNPRLHDADGSPWSRVVTMEDLARALKTGEALRKARVSLGEGALTTVNPVPTPVSAPAPSPTLLRLRTSGPEDDPTSGVWLPRPLLRVLHR